MKTIFTLLLSLSISGICAQAMFVHNVEPGNTAGDASYIDHPDLNGNPDAQLLVTHNWNPNGTTGIYNDNTTGVFYSVTQQRWGVYNESGASIIQDSSYNVYIKQDAEVFLHIADVANQSNGGIYSVINHPNLNNNPDAHIILTTYFNPNGVRNDFNYAVWYDDADDRWKIFTEDIQNIPLDSAFFIGIAGGVGVSTKHQATAATITGNYTIIDHPMLNGDSDAVFQFTHNWGTTGDSSNVLSESTMSVWYTGTNWSIYTEDLSAMPEDIEFNLFIYDATLGTTSQTIDGLSYAPNPVTNTLAIRATEELSQVTIFNILGQEVAQQKIDGISSTISMESLPTGNYLARVSSGNKVQVIKLVKI